MNFQPPLVGQTLVIESTDGNSVQDMCQTDSSGDQNLLFIHRTGTDWIEVLCNAQTPSLNHDLEGTSVRVRKFSLHTHYILGFSEEIPNKSAK